MPSVARQSLESYLETDHFLADGVTGGDAGNGSGVGDGGGVGDGDSVGDDGGGGGGGSGGGGSSDRRSAHSFFALASQQEYQLCYQVLRDIEPYWQGIKHILAVMDQKAKGVVDPLLYTDEEMESVDVHWWPPYMFDLFKNTRKKSTDPAAGAAVGAVGAEAESGRNRQSTTAGLLFQGCTEQYMHGGFPGDGMRSLFVSSFLSENTANRVSRNQRVHGGTHGLTHVGAHVSATGIS